MIIKERKQSIYLKLDWLYNKLMIAYLKGELVVKSEEYIIIEVQGIGY